MKNIRALQITHYFKNVKIWLSFWNDDLIWSKYIYWYILLSDAVLPEMASSSLEKLQKDLNNNSPHLGYRLHSN